MYYLYNLNNRQMLKILCHEENLRYYRHFRPIAALQH